MASVLSTAHPDKVPELMVYLSVIIKTTRGFDGYKITVTVSCKTNYRHSSRHRTTVQTARTTPADTIQIQDQHIVSLL